MKTTLIIGDAHADPRFSNERFTALGRLITTLTPDYIIDMGDWGNLDSISFHTRGKPLLREGMRLSDDIDSMQDAHNKLMAPIKALNQRASNWKKKHYKPIMKKLEGNHENRVKRYLHEAPELVGFIPSTDLCNATNDGWEIVEYKNYTFHEGIAFTHIPMNPRMNSPIGGKYTAHRALEGQQQSIVYGHTHELNVESVRRNDLSGGRTLYAIGTGCYFDYDPDYIRGNEPQLNWWRGIVLLHHIADGEVDIETMSIDRIKQDYL
jgi:hypothetical protein